MTSDGSVRMLVNLGWVPGKQRRDELPSIEIPAVFELKGLWVPVTDSYLMSESDAETLGNAQRVQSLTDLIKTDLLPGIVLADGLLPRNAKGPKPRLGPETHYGYAIHVFVGQCSWNDGCILLKGYGNRTTFGSFKLRSHDRCSCTYLANWLPARTSRPIGAPARSILILQPHPGEPAARQVVLASVVAALSNL